MKIRILFAAFALFMGLATVADAQGRGRNNNSRPNRGNHQHYNGNGGNHHNRYNYGRAYNRHRPIRYRQVNYCQPVRVVYQQPCYRPVPRVVYGGRPRINVNIGF